MESKEVQRKLNSVDQQYCDLLIDIYNTGVKKKDRTGTGTISVFGRQLRFNMSEGFPLLTSKQMYTKGIIVELLWFLGKHWEQEPYHYLSKTNIKYLVDNNCNIWVGDAYKKYVRCCSDNTAKYNYWMRSNPDRSFSMYTKKEFIGKIKTDLVFAKQWGDLGPVYGKQWRMWEDGDLAHPVDQIRNLVDDLKANPDSRRLMVNAWNPADLDKMVLPPCHYGFQCYTRVLSMEERVKIYQDTGGKDGSTWRRSVGHYLYPEDYIQEHDEDIPDPIGFELSDEDLAFLGESGIPTRELSLMWNQRSVDTPLGLPFNIASYGFLLHMLADHVGMIPGELIGMLGDTHIYNDQMEGVVKQLANPTFRLPTLKIKPGERKDLADYNIDDFSIEDYENAGLVEYPLSN